MMRTCRFLARFALVVSTAISACEDAASDDAEIMVMDAGDGGGSSPVETADASDMALPAPAPTPGTMPAAGPAPTPMPPVTNGPTPTVCKEADVPLTVGQSMLRNSERAKIAAPGCVNFGFTSGCTLDERMRETVCRSAGGPNARRFETIRIDWLNGSLTGEVYGETSGQAPVYLARLVHTYAPNMTLSYFRVEAMADWLLYVPSSPTGHRVGKCSVFDSTTAGLNLCVPWRF
jgi:hypothetical protein